MNNYINCGFGFFIMFSTMLISCRNHECGVEFSDEEYEMIEDGELFQRKGEYDRAIAKYNRVIQSNSYNYVAMSNLAGCIYEKDKLQTSKHSISRCLDLLEGAIDICPGFKPAYTNIVTIASDYQVSKVALYYGFLCDSIFGESCYIDVKRANSYLEINDTVKAKLIIDKQISLGCTISDLYLNSAKYYEKINDFSSAEEILKQLIKDSPGNDIALVMLGNIKLEKDNLEKARFYYEEALLYNDSNFEANLRLSEIHFHQRNKELGCNYLGIASELGKSGLYSILYSRTLQELSEKFCNP